MSLILPPSFSSPSIYKSHLSKWFHNPWPPNFLFPGSDCCYSCFDESGEPTCADSIPFTTEWEFALAGIADGTEGGCSAFNRTYTLTRNSGFGIHSWGFDADMSYSFGYELNWSVGALAGADLDAYVREYFLPIGPNPLVTYFNSPFGHSITLSHDAFAGCIGGGPFDLPPPEIISTSTFPSADDIESPEAFEVWYNQYSCEPETPPTTNLVTITNNEIFPIIINVLPNSAPFTDDITIVPSGDSFTHTAEYAGLSPDDKIDGGVPSFVTAKKINVGGMSITLECNTNIDTNNKYWQLIIGNFDLGKVAWSNPVIYEKNSLLNCCENAIFTLVTDPGLCTGWPATLTLVPSGGTGC